MAEEAPRLAPCAWIAIAISAAVTCSPVAASASTSRASGTGRDVRRQLEQPVRLAGHRADDDHDVITGPLGGERPRGAPVWMRSTEPTEVPPNFWTMRLTRGVAN